ncbi:MAG TPA: hypothetical protein VJ743_04965 [Albitalea sp.]|nr:hypothetical protein [Albitalea sp.]
MTTSTLSFTIRPVANGIDLRRACEVRAESYGHHVPGWRQSFIEPDTLDHDASATVLLCEDKNTGAAIGTARIQTAQQGPLLIERCIDVPAAMARQGRAEITRLSAVRGADMLVKVALWKATYLYCQATQSRWMIIGARNEALVRQYRRLGFQDVHPEGQMVPLRHAGGVMHRVLAMDTYAAERNWLERQHGLYDFVFETYHPDIQIMDRLVVPAQFDALAA